MQPIPIETRSGLSILPVSAAHAPMLAALVRQDNDHLSAWLPKVASLSSVDAACAHLERAAVHAAAGEIFEWHLFTDDCLCGSVRLRDIDHADRKAAVGYFLGSEFTGRGIVTEALQAVLAWCFGALDLKRIELRCATGNAPGIGVAERLGFVRERVLRQEECLHGVFVDLYVYGLSLPEFALAAERGAERTRQARSAIIALTPSIS